jgi:hypothetical protein
MVDNVNRAKLLLNQPKIGHVDLALVPMDESPTPGMKRRPGTVPKAEYRMSGKRKRLCKISSDKSVSAGD